MSRNQNRQRGTWNRNVRSRRQLANNRRHIRLRSQARDQQLDVALAHVPRGIEQFEMICGRQMRSEKTHRREVQRSIGQPVEDYRKTSRQSRSFDAQVGSMLRQVQPLHAVGEQRRVSLSRVQLPRVHFHEQRDQLRRRVSLACNCTLELCQQIAIGKIVQADDGDVMFHVYHRQFPALVAGLIERDRACDRSLSLLRTSTSRSSHRRRCERAFTRAIACRSRLALRILSSVFFAKFEIREYFCVRAARKCNQLGPDRVATSQRFSVIPATITCVPRGTQRCILPRGDCDDDVGYRADVVGGADNGVGSRHVSRVNRCQSYAPPDRNADPVSGYWHISADQLLWAPASPPGVTATGSADTGYGPQERNSHSPLVVSTCLDRPLHRKRERISNWFLFRRTRHPY